MAKKKDVLGHDPLMALDEMVPEPEVDFGEAQITDNDVSEPAPGEDGVFRFGASLSIAEIEETREHLLSSVEGGQMLSLDLEDTNYIDGAGLQLLIALEKSLDAREVSYEWKGVGEEIKEQMALFGLSGFFTV
jgi:anti-anti-sigma regulatory factor